MEERPVERQVARQDSGPNAAVTGVAANLGNVHAVALGLGIVAGAAELARAVTFVGLGLGLGAADVAEAAVGAGLVGYGVAEAAFVGMAGVLRTLVAVAGLAQVVLVAAAGRQVSSRGLCC